MSDNPYESPRHAASDPLPAPKGDWLGTISRIKSVVAIVVADFLTTLVRPSLPDWALQPFWFLFIAIGLSYVWYSHWAVRFEQSVQRRRLNLQNDELNS